MEGYVKNISSTPQYIMKRHVLPGAVISIEDLTDRYLEQSGATKSTVFVKWLRKFVFSGVSMWEINISDTVVESTEAKPSDEENTVENNEDANIVTEQEVKVNDSKKVTVNLGSVIPAIEAKDLVTVSYKKCAELAARCMDPKVIKEALQRANTMPRKAKTCNILRERLAELA